MKIERITGIVIALSLCLLVVLSGCGQDEEGQNEQNEKEISGIIENHDKGDQILEIGSDRIMIDFLPKLISLKGQTVYITKVEPASSDISEFSTRLDDNIEFDNITSTIKVEGQVKVYTDKEVAILLDNDKGLPELSVTAEFDENIPPDLNQGDVITIEGKLRQVKFDWYRMGKCKILLVH